MKATLIKEKGCYDLYRIDENGKRITFASTQDYKQKLSKQNCDEIFGIVDVEKLADEYIVVKPKYREHEHNLAVSAYKEGFHKAMELNKDKVFTVEDMHEALHLMNNTPRVPIVGEALEIVRKETEIRESIVDAILVSKQPTEIEVEIEMDYCYYPANLPKEGEQRPTMRPKLDENGCLILKKL